MRLAPDKIKTLCRRRHTSLEALLHQAGVSRTAYYSLIRKESVIPKSIRIIARTLNVPVSRILAESAASPLNIREWKRILLRIQRRHPQCDPDTIRHTLLCLQDKPIERLKRGLIRAQNIRFND